MAGVTALSELPTTWAGEIGVSPADLKATAALSTGLVFAWRIPFDNAATATLVLDPLPFQVKIIGVRAHKRGSSGASGNTLQLKQGSNLVSDALDMNVATGAVVQAASIYATYDDIDSGASLSVINTRSGGDSAMLVIIEAIRIG